MNVELSERDRGLDKQERRERESKSQSTTRSMRGDRGNSGIPGERECKREKNDGEIQMWERKEGKQVLNGRRGKKV
jgi:hypothetical protein